MWLVKKYEEGHLYHPEVQKFCDRLFALKGWDKAIEIKGDVDLDGERKWAKPYLPNAKKIEEKNAKEC